MSRVLTEKSNFENIADAIRAKGVTGTFTPSEMATKIGDIPAGGTYQEKTATTNGVVTPDTGYDALSSVTVSIPVYDNSYVILYSITPTLTNCTASSSNESYIEENGSVTLIYTFDGTSYVCPSTAPIVTGATGSWTKNSDTQGTLVLSNASGNVSFSLAGINVYK